MEFDKKKSARYFHLQVEDVFFKAQRIEYNLEHKETILHLEHRRPKTRLQREEDYQNVSTRSAPTLPKIHGPIIVV